MRAISSLAPLSLAALVAFSSVGCKKLLGSIRGEDAGADASATVASADPNASAAATGTASAAPSATVAAAPAPKATAKTTATVKKVLPKCAAGQGLFAEDDTSAPFCGKLCSNDAECKPAKCDSGGFMVDDKTGIAFVGVGKNVTLCGKGAAAGSASASPSAASSSVVLAIPPGAPALIQNPNNQPCPVGYSNAGGVLKTCNKTCANGGKCPAGSKCSDVLLVCR